MFDIASLTRFRRETDGYITLEALIVMPALLWIFGAGWVYFDAFRQQSVNQKANYTISDMISRETDPVDGGYIDNARNLLQMLTKSTAAENGLRVTIVEYDSTNGWQVMWSETRGAPASLTTGDLADYVNRLPTVASGDQLILVETWEDYDPVIDVGLGAFTIKTYSFTRPRYTPQVPYAIAQAGTGGGGSGEGEDD